MDKKKIRLVQTRVMQSVLLTDKIKSHTSAHTLAHTHMEFLVYNSKWFTYFLHEFCGPPVYSSTVCICITYVPGTQTP